MKTIWKYELELGMNEIQIPSGYQFLDVQLQRGKPCAWFLIEQNNQRVDCKIRIIMTGYGIYDDDAKNLTYWGTFQLLSENLVFHVFHDGSVENGNY